MTTRIPTLEGDAKFAGEARLIAELAQNIGFDAAARTRISARAAELVRRIRAETRPGMLEQFLGEYGLSTHEGVALMCLAEAMLRVPDRATIDALIEDKIAPSDWGRHLGAASSSLVNASTWALMLTGRVLENPEPGLAGTLRGAIKRLGEPVIRTAVTGAMKELGRQFVLGETIEDAMARARKREARGFTFSYDMLGEAAVTQADAGRFARAYAEAIAAIGARSDGATVRSAPGISVKLSALHPRYEVAQEARVMSGLVPVLGNLARLAAGTGIGLNVDAEEQSRLVLSLQVIEQVLSDPELAGWDGFGVVVQAYGKRAGPVIDWLYDLAKRLDRRIMVRLVKGAYWDTEMKRAQVEGLPDFPLFTTKAATDVSYLANARKLLDMGDRIYPQFATHNAHTVAAIAEIAKGRDFEFQRLHGMGAQLYDIVRQESGAACRIYAPVGAHRDLLAYLVRRLLENGANSSFVHQIVDKATSPEEIARDPLEALLEAMPPTALVRPAELFAPSRRNSHGMDLSDGAALARIYAARDVALPDAAPLIAGAPSGPTRPVASPTDGTVIAKVQEADSACISRALAAAQPWDAPAGARAETLRRAADLYETEFGPFFAALGKEAGKTLADALSELREAVDFLRYYAAEAERSGAAPLGVFAAISPWNFPLAIFTGQIAAALATGNAVLAKPAEQTPITAAMAVRLLYRAGVPPTALQLLPGDGPSVGAALTSDPRVSGVVFTGSTETARLIRASMAAHLRPGAPLIAETGGLNAMVVDSTALPEQAVRDIVSSAFNSAGQRCSALRCLYLQEEIAPGMIEMIRGAMDELVVSDPWQLSTDIGPLIDAGAHEKIAAHIEQARAEGRVLHQLTAPKGGHFIGPVLIGINSIADLREEIFGPVLHVARFKADEISTVIEAVNATGYGLTFGLHSRIDRRVQRVTDAVRAGNIYVNRNQIGAVVGSQPFGGEGLSGTGPKAGGPHYLQRFRAKTRPRYNGPGDGLTDGISAMSNGVSGLWAARIGQMVMPGPTGELNRLTLTARAPLLCLGPGPQAEEEQANAVKALGGAVVRAGGAPRPEVLEKMQGFSGAIWWGDDDLARAYAQALARRPGPILPLITDMPDIAHVGHERHLCVDTTASGGNAALLAGRPVAG